jgi:S-adenosylmethionine-diacylglycerol 3-amino-3-carboxypropyl transferase
MPDSLEPTPNPWALEAARLPVAFAQVREDPRLDCAIAERLSRDASVVMIASGGETLVELARHPSVRRILAVDMNPSQLALARLKCRLASSEAPQSSLRILGHEAMPPEDRQRRMQALLAGLGFPEEIFGPADFIAIHGADHAGRYERCFAELRKDLCSSDIFTDSQPLDDALARSMSLPNLVALFGQQATQNPAQPFHEHFAARTRLALSRSDAATNPFLWQMYRGSFPADQPYDWLRLRSPLHAEIETAHGRMREVLDGLPASSTDMIHLSNILDWLSAEEAAETLASARRVLRAGGWIILRQLNSTLDFSALGEGLSWREELGRVLEQRDRSFFYPRIHVATRS